MPSAHTTLWKACARLVATRWDSLREPVESSPFLPTRSTTHSHRFPQALPLFLPLAKTGFTHILHTAYYYHH